MPEISRFFGIVIAMYHRDHEPPHFHARYGSQKVVVRIADGSIEGKFPPRAQALVLEWWNLHRHELAENWRLAKRTERTDADFSIGVTMQDVVEARYVSGYVLWLRFEDGAQGEVDLSAELDGPIFDPLREIDYFQRFFVNEDTGTVEWPNRADFAPEFLYERLRLTA